jgi:hypothetical protein
MKIKIKDLDMSEADGYVMTESGIIYNAVKEDGLEGRNLLYSGLEGKKLKTLLKEGTLYPKSKGIYASEFPERDESETKDTTPLSCAWERKKPMIAVYDGDKFESLGRDRYKFLDRNNKLETLLAVYFLKWKSHL